MGRAVIVDAYYLNLKRVAVAIAEDAQPGRNVNFIFAQVESIDADFRTPEARFQKYKCSSYKA